MFVSDALIAHIHYHLQMLSFETINKLAPERGWGVMSDLEEVAHLKTFQVYIRWHVATFLSMSFRLEDSLTTDDYTNNCDKPRVKGFYCELSWAPWCFLLLLLLRQLSTTHAFHN